MKFYQHRVNSSIDLQRVKPEFGVELDLRSLNGKLILSHDPFKNGEFFENWLESWKGQSLILNVKEDGLEDKVIQTLLNHNINDYFFLDQHYPTIHKLVNNGFKKVATRFSDLEDINTALNSKSEWIWIDCFSGKWEFLEKELDNLLSGFQKTCLVSPELHNRNSDSELQQLLHLIKSSNAKFDAICTKRIDFWNENI